MRRSTAAAFGTLTGAALILGVRLSVSAPVVTAAPPPSDLANADSHSSKKPTKNTGGAAAADESRFKDGAYKGKAVNYPYGTIQVSIKVSAGKVSAADATYPLTGNSATINPRAIPQLKQETLRAQSAHVGAVSGATYTSRAYAESLQAALDAAQA
jgi:uncharacterized protein with FMN-binding domain